MLLLEPFVILNGNDHTLLLHQQLFTAPPYVTKDMYINDYVTHYFL